MLRSFLIYLSKAAWAQNLVTNCGFAWKVASRFVAGTKITEALDVVKTLNAKGINATLDQLGEHTNNAEEANKSTEGILAVLDAIQAANVRSNVSIKLTQIGMGTDNDLCRANLLRIVERAKKYGNFVRIDIEDTPWTDLTIALYHDVLIKGYDTHTVGMAAQAYLYRADADIHKMLEEGITFRLVKGAYKEPSELAYPKKADVDTNYDTLVSKLLDASLIQKTTLSKDGRHPPIPGIATHDEKRIAFAKAYAEKIGLTREGFEFQMLYGIRRDLQENLCKEGYPMRVYVPFGTHWYPYFMRRLAERPANIWFFISNSFRK